MNKEVLQMLLEYIEIHINEKIYLDELANIAGYSPFYFSQLFSKYTGVSVTTYIRVRKLQYAMASLQNGGKVIEVSNQYAFESHEGFTRSFKRLFGSTPKTVKKYLQSYSVPEYVIPNIPSRKDEIDMKKSDNLSDDMHEILFAFIQESINEAREGYCTEVTIKLLSDNRVSIMDNSRGLPLSDKKDFNQQVFANVLAGAPITMVDYDRMEDIKDIKLQVANSLCEFLSVTVYKSEEAYKQEYVRGIAQQDVSCEKSNHPSGMYIVLQPDKKIFSDTVFSKEKIEEWMKERARDIELLNICIICESENE